MLIAELRNKLAADGSNVTDRSEDILTSNVFGLLRYPPAYEVLLPWLRGARPLVPGARPLVSADAVEAHLDFWPRVREREMDLCLVARGPSGEEVVGIECKLESDASPATKQPALADRSLVVQRGNQLADYWDALVHDEVRPASWTLAARPPRALLYLTADPSCPVDTFEHALKHLREEARESARRSFYWTHWQSLPEVLHAWLEREPDVYRQRIGLDLLALLERKNLVPFRGFTSPAATASVCFRRGIEPPPARKEAGFHYQRKEAR